MQGSISCSLKANMTRLKIFVLIKSSVLRSVRKMLRSSGSIKARSSSSLSMMALSKSSLKKILNGGKHEQ